MAHPSQERPAGRTPPRTPTEDVITGIWRDVLGRTGIGVFDSFFDLGANSLHTIQVVSRIRKTLGVDIPVRDFFREPTVAALAETVAAGSSAERRVIGRRAPGEDPVLSFDQERLWLDTQLLPSSAYNVHGRRRLVGPLDVDVLDRSVRAIVARHETLRTRFPVVAGSPTQVVDELDDGWHVAFVDLTAVDTGDDVDRAEEARRLADDQAVTAFDLEHGPLFRCLIVRLGESAHLLSVTLHHIVSDAWSIGLFVRELSALYESGGDPDRAQLPVLPIQYRDYAAWQRELLTGDLLDREVGYWRDHLAGAPPALALPTSGRHAPGQTAVGGRIRSALSAAASGDLREFCRKQGVTPFMTLMAALATVLSRWSGQDDLVIGAPVATRADVGTDALIGFFVNTLPLRVDLTGAPTFAELLTRVRTSALDGYAHTDAPFDTIVKNVPGNRDRRRSPVFQVILNVIGSPEAEEIAGLEVEQLEVPVPPSKFDLTVTAQEVDGELRIETAFNASRYDTAVVEAIVAHLHTVLDAVVRDPGRSVLDYAFAAEPKARLAAPAPPVGVWSLGTTVVDGAGAWSRARLCRAADHVERTLAELRYSGRVGVVRRPEAAFVAAVLGCVQAGAAVTVVEPDSPVAPRFLGVSTVLDVRPAGPLAADTVDLSALSAIPDDAAAEIPVPAPRAAEPGPLGLRATDRVAVLSPSLGLLRSALTGACAAGATVVVAPESFADGGEELDSLVVWLGVNEVSIVYTAPPLLRAIGARAPRLPALRRFVVDNDGGFLARDVVDLRSWASRCEVVGVYRIGSDGRPGATFVVPADLSAVPRLRVPLGTSAAALAHTSGQVAANGEVAEIVLGDDRTGDRGRRLDGVLELVAADPGADRLETTAAMWEVDGVLDALVVEHEDLDGHSMLVGYVATADPDLGVAAIRRRLDRKLPEHLVPRQLFLLDALPLTGLGEYDLAALPEPDEDGGPVEMYVAPRTPIEQQLVDILQELLELDRISVHDTFFELGAFSLLVTRLSSRVREIFGVELSLRSVFEAATVSELAQVILQAQVEDGEIDDLEALLAEIEAS